MATDSGFTAIAWESLADASNLLSVQLPAGVLNESTLYYVRARHHGDNGTGNTQSAWSNHVSFTTAASFYLANEVAILMHSGTQGMGGAVALSRDGNVALLGAERTDWANSKRQWASHRLQV